MSQPESTFINGPSDEISQPSQDTTKVVPAGNGSLPHPTNGGFTRPPLTRLDSRLNISPRLPYTTQQGATFRPQQPRPQFPGPPQFGSRPPLLKNPTSTQNQILRPSSPNPIGLRPGTPFPRTQTPPPSRPIGVYQKSVPSPATPKPIIEQITRSQTLDSTDVTKNVENSALPTRTNEEETPPALAAMKNRSYSLASNAGEPSNIENRRFSEASLENVEKNRNYDIKNDEVPSRPESRAQMKKIIEDENDTKQAEPTPIERTENILEQNKHNQPTNLKNEKPPINTNLPSPAAKVITEDDKTIQPTSQSSSSDVKSHKEDDSIKKETVRTPSAEKSKMEPTVFADKTSNLTKSTNEPKEIVKTPFAEKSKIETVSADLSNLTKSTNEPKEIVKPPSAEKSKIEPTVSADKTSNLTKSTNEPKEIVKTPSVEKNKTEPTVFADKTSNLTKSTNEPKEIVKTPSVEKNKIEPTVSADKTSNLTKSTNEPKEIVKTPSVEKNKIEPTVCADKTSDLTKSTNEPKETVRTLSAEKTKIEPTVSADKTSNLTKSTNEPKEIVRTFSAEKNKIEPTADKTSNLTKSTNDPKLNLKLDENIPNTANKNKNGKTPKSPTSKERKIVSDKPKTLKPETKNIKNGMLKSPTKSEGDNDSGVDETTQGNDQSSNGDHSSPKKSSGKTPTRTTASPTKSRSESSGSKTPNPKTPESPTPSTPGTIEKRKLPMNKVHVGSAPSPNLKVVKSKIGSFQNTSYKPGGGNIKIEHKKIDLSNVQSKIAAKNETYVPGGGEKKIEHRKLQWKVTSKIGSLENTHHKPKGGEKKIETMKFDFKDKAKPKVGSKKNIRHQPGGGDVKSEQKMEEVKEPDVKEIIETKKLDVKAKSKVGSLDNVKYKPGGGDKKIFDDKEYLRQKSGLSGENASLNGSQNSLPSQEVGEPVSDENLNRE